MATRNRRILAALYHSYIDARGESACSTSGHCQIIVRGNPQKSAGGDSDSNRLAELVTDTVVATVYDLDITRGGQNITNTTTDVMVGEKLSLAGTLLPADLPITSRLWIVPGSRIKNYVQTTEHGTVTALEASDLGSNTVDYYWIDGATGLEVSYQVLVGGLALGAEATFNVLRPTDVSLTSTTTSETPPVDVRAHPTGGTWLQFGSYASPGITWTAELTSPAIGAGAIAFTQLINPDRHRTLDPEGTTQAWTSNGDFVLDDPTPYGGDSATIGSSETKILSSRDSPRNPLTANIRESSASDNYRLYLMYKPSGAGGIWVTLRRLDWYWNGSATKDTQTGIWSLDAGQSSSVNPGSVDCTTLPTWDAYFTNLGWQ